MRTIPTVLIFWLLIFSGGWLHAAPPGELPETDARLRVRTLRSACGMEEFRSKEEWLKRAASLRRQILVSAGLWPLPEKTPLNPQIFGRIEKEDYTIEKVYFESYPGFYVTGNLYRPRGRKGPFPGIVSPHGHWQYGRLENKELGSVPGRAIQFARMGAVVFTYDMVGYNDSFQVSHEFRGTREELWGVNLLGLHLWNSIRVTDFLESLPDVDKDRLACTGASGGGTQTFLLTAVDDRIKVSAPVNMISGHMQGGDICENAPQLRIDTCNIEIGALMAPRPMLMVSVTGDWTTDTPRVEFPAIRSIYSLLDAEEKVKNFHSHALHNYNRASREAVYTWFSRWLLGNNSEGPVVEKRFRVEMPPDVLVFFGREKPKEAKTSEQLTEYLIRRSEERLASLKPKNGEGLNRFAELMRPALRYTLMAERPDAGDVQAESQGSGAGGERLLLKHKGSRIEGVLWGTRAGRRRPGVVLVHPRGYPALLDNSSRQPGRLVSDLLRSGFAVLGINPFMRPDSGQAGRPLANDEKFFATYNRTDDSNRIQDILTALAYLEGRRDISEVSLVGLEKAGLWALLARPAAPEVKRLVADAAQFPADDDQAYLRDLPIPGIRRAGDFRTAVTLAAPGALLLHNTGKEFSTTWAEDVYKASGAEKSLTVKVKKVSENEIVRWLRGR